MFARSLYPASDQKRLNGTCARLVLSEKKIVHVDHLKANDRFDQWCAVSVAIHGYLLYCVLNMIVS